MLAATATAPDFTFTEAQQIANKLFSLGDIEKVSPLGGYIDQNFLITLVDSRRFVLKIHDANEKEAVLDFQNEMMDFLRNHVGEHMFPTAINNKQGQSISSMTGKDGRRHSVRLLKFLPGRLLGEKELPGDSYQQLGRLVATMDCALADFDHPAANRADLPWDLKNALAVAPLSRYIDDHHQRRLADYFFLQYESVVQPAMPELRKAIVHNDVHRFSVLLDKRQQINGIFDFGDAVYTQLINGVAVSVADAMLWQEHPISTAFEFIQAYHEHNPLTAKEVSLLYYLVATRLAIYGSMAAYQRSTAPDNTHTQIKEQAVWRLLDQLIAINPLYVENEFRKACAMPSILSTADNGSAVIESRNQYFGKSLKLHYREPLHLSKGALQYLYTEDGRSYLDCVNNVCQWGHCHPRIARAARQQITELNTNSRYLYNQLVDYAQRLTATLPEPLNVCFFVNSGSEANDLAMRMARAYTGHDDMVVIDKAYHGNSTSCTEISPHRIDRAGGPGLPSHVHKVITPDTYRGPFKRDDPEAGDKYAKDIADTVANISQQGRGVAAFVAESMVGTGGQLVLPDNYLKQAYRTIRAAGGICIADEVQMGFGRVGSHTWCFETQNVVPDIVTMGKPIGNGHPMAAVVTTAEIAAAFDNGVPYVNTFGGNPVSCATGLAVLDVLEKEQLQENASLRGRQLMQGLTSMAETYDCIADVRGLGLYIGVELVQDRDTLEPATQLAEQVVEAMKAEGILLNTNGYDNNIIKIKPPLIISESNVERILNTFDHVLNLLTR